MALVGKLKIDPSFVSKPSADFKQSLKSSLHSDFKQNVIKIVRQIPLGRVTTYGTIATLAGVPRGARIVGGILHYSSNEFNLPWQRVVNRHGFISTRCEGHTKQDQKEILEQEGVEVSDDFMINLDKFGWWGK